MSRETTDPGDPDLGHGVSHRSEPQNAAYLVLSKEERAKGFVRPVRRSYLHQVCGSVTTMSQGIAETYARRPSFYGATYCCGCEGHYAVGEDSKFVWLDDGTKVGT